MNINFAETAAVFCTGLFAGAAVYVGLVEHPARIECGPESGIKQFASGYRKAAAMQASLAMLSFLFSIWAWYLNHNRTILIAGFIVFLAIPFTLLVILPTNKRMVDPTLDKSSDEARGLLVKWERLHFVRMMLGLIG